MENRDPSRQYYVALTFILCTSIAFLGFAQKFAASIRGPYPWQEALLWQLWCWYLWGLVAWLIMKIVQRYPLGPAFPFTHVLIHGSAALFLSGFHFLINICLVWPFVAFEEPLVGWITKYHLLCGYAYLYRLLLYMGILSVCCWVYYYTGFRNESIRLVQMRAALLSGQLQRLRAQLNPGFVFSTLKSISKLMRKDLEQAETLISLLGSFLRTCLDTRGAATVTLDQELRLARVYLQIETLRRRNNLKFVIDAKEDCLPLNVPGLILFTTLCRLLKECAEDEAVRLVLSFHCGTSGCQIKVQLEGSHTRISDTTFCEIQNRFAGADFESTASQTTLTWTVADQCENTEMRELPRSTELNFSHNAAAKNRTVSKIFGSESIRFIGLFAIWTLVAFCLVQRELHIFPADHPVSFAERSYLYSIWYLWAAASPLVLWFTKRFMLLEKQRLRNFMLHMVWNAVIWASVVFLSRLFLWLISDNTNLSELLVDGFRRSRFSMDVVLYWVIVAVYSGYSSYQQAAHAWIEREELKSQMIGAQLEAFKMKLHPHFVFNALNSLSEVMHQELKAAETMLSRLQSFLAFTFKHSEAQVLPLREELEFMRCYLDIQYVRFGDRLAVDLEIDPRAMDVSLPNLFWQPVVENAIRHGISRRDNSGEVQIRAYLKNSKLNFEVQDNGPGLDSKGWREGFGLNSTRELLHRIYGDSQSLQIHNIPTGGLLARIEIPVGLTV